MNQTNNGHRHSRTALLIVVIYFTTTGLFCSVAPIDEAKALLEEGNFSAAQATYNRLLEHDPRNFAAHYGAGMALCAEALYKTKLDLVSPHDWYGAIFHMEMAHSLRPADKTVSKKLAIFHFNLGTCFRKSNSEDKSLSQFEQALSIDSTLLKAANLLGTIYHQRGNFEKARKFYYHTLTLDPHYAMAHFNLGALSWAENDFIKAEEHFANALDAAPNNDYFKTWLSNARRQNKEE